MSTRKPYYPTNDDDFWNDCYKDIHPISSNNRNNTSNQSYRISLKKPNQSKLIEEILFEEERRIERLNQANKHCHTLYNQSIMKNELNKTLYNHKQKEIEAQELSKCTWKPKLIKNRSFDSKLKDYSNMHMYKRGSLHLQRHNDKISNYVRAKSLKDIPLNYKPKWTMNTKLQNIFMEAQKTTTESDSNKLFLYRYHKAKEEEEYKKNRLVTDLGKNIGNKWEKKKKRLMRSISIRDVYVVRQTLHDNLQECETLNNDF